MNIEELVKMPDPEFLRADGGPAYTYAQMANMRYQVAAAVAKRCADLCESKAGTSEYDDSTSRYLAQDIRREFGEVSNG